MTSTQAGIVLRHIRGLAARKPSAELPDGQLLERFTNGNDTTAFEALLQRHGAMVLGVCRRVLRDPNDAEDAFQATFCVLAQKARSVRRQESIGGWLYQVACNAALKARSRAATRQRHERRSGRPVTADPLSELTGRELLTALDEEMARLSERLRGPLVLCYLEGKTRDEAARDLGLSFATLKRRLEEGKTALRKRLARRGLALPAALLASGLATATVPARLAAATAQTAAGTMMVSASVAALVRSSLRSMAARPLKTLGALLLAVTLVAAGLWGYAAPAAPPADAKDTPQAAPKDDQPAPRSDAKPAAANEMTYRGTILDANGKPIGGAKVYLLRPGPKTGDAPKVRAITDKDGRYSFSAPPDEGLLFVTAEGFGPSWPVKLGKIDDVQLRLTRDDVPIRGRIFDLQGQPVVGATVRVEALKTPRDGKLDQWLEAVKVRRDGLPTEQDHMSSFANGAFPHFFPPTATDKEGRFEIKGLGRERVVALTIEGPTIETQIVNVIQRPGVSEVRLPMFAQLTVAEQLVYRPPTFDYVAAPCRVVSGIVRDKETRKPLAGAVVRVNDILGNPVSFIQTTTDKDGKYRLTGVPRKPRRPQGNAIVALPPDGKPLLALSHAMPADKDAPAVIDFDLPHGVWLEGQVKDKVTGRGVKARLGYLIFAGGPNEDEVRSLYIPPLYGMTYYTDREGKFRIVVAPYRGLIGARAEDEGRDRYRAGVGADKIDGKRENQDGTFAFAGYPSTIQATSLDTMMEIKPAKGAKSLTCDLVLDPGRTVTVQVRGPDGKPLEGTHAFGQYARGMWYYERLPAEFTMYALAPGEKRTLLLRHPEKNLTARYQLKGDENGPIVVTLEPGAAVKGRLLDDIGRPLKQAEIMLIYREPKGGAAYLLSREIRTDDDGKFRLDGLLPGMIWSASVMVPDEQPLRRPIFTELSAKSGETKDLGDVKPQKGGGMKKGEE